MPTSAAAPRFSPPWYHSLIADPARASRAGVGLVLAVLMAWSLGSKDFGALQAALALASLLAAATSLGLDPLVRQQLRTQPYETASTLGTSMALRCGLGLIAYLAMLCFTSKNQATPQSIWLVAALMVLMQTPLLLSLRLEEAGHIERVRFARNFGFGFSSLLVAAMIWRNADPVWFACAIVLEQPIVALLLLYGHGRIAPEEEAFTWDWAIARSWLRQCRATWSAPLLPLLIVPASLLMLVGRGTASQAGSLGVALAFFEAGAFCALAIFAGYLANRAVASGDEPAPDADPMDQAFRRGALIGWICAAAAAALSVGLGLTLLRHAIPGLPLVGSLVATALVPHVLGRVRDTQCSREAQKKSRTRTLLVIAGLNLILGVFLDKPFGSLGAAASLVAASIVGELIAPFFVASERKLARSQGKALIVFHRRHGASAPAPEAAPAMATETALSAANAEPGLALPARVRSGRSAESSDAIAPAGVAAKSS